VARPSSNVQDWMSKKYKGQHKPHNPLLYMSPNLRRNRREEKMWQSGQKARKGFLQT
jgi:hypothetical protein